MFRYQIKFYLVWDSDAFKENHSILFGELLVREKYWNHLHIFEISISLKISMFY